ncbi:MAG: cytochrome P450 [Thermodesulfobacteriota bacterium]
MSGAPVFDLLDPALQVDPFAAYARLRDDAPVHLAAGPKGEPVYVLSRYDDVARALKDPQTFSSQVAPPPILMFKDPPEHTRLRRTLARAFTPRAIDALAPRIEAVACELYELYLAAGGGDFIDAFAHPLPALVIGELLGVPAERRRELRRWSDDSIRALGGGVGLSKEERAAARAGAMELFAVLQAVLDGYRERPTDTIGGELARLTIAGELTSEEALYFSQFLFVAGHETTTGLFGCGAELLAREPALFDRLRGDPDLVPRFVEEVLRRTPSLHRLFRRTTSAVTLHGVTIPGGAAVLLLLGAANRDPRRFPAGDAVDLDADPSGQLAFGLGIHVCLGAPLARLEGRIGFRVLLERTKRLALDPAHVPVPITGGTTSEFGWRVLHLRAAPA